MILSHHHDTIPPSPRYSDFSHDKENHQSFPSPSQSINPHQQKSSTALGNTRSRADKPVSSSLRPFLRSSSRRGPVASPYDRPPEGATKSKASIRHKNRRKGHLPAIKCDGPDDDQSLEPTSSPSVARSTGPVVYSKSSALLPLSLPRPDRMAFIDVASVEGMEGIVSRRFPLSFAPFSSHLPTIAHSSSRSSVLPPLLLPAIHLCSRTPRRGGTQPSSICSLRSA